MAQRSTLNIHKNLDDLGPKMALPPLRMELTNFGGPIKFQNFRIFGGEKNEMYHKIEKVDFLTEKFSVEFFADFFSVFADFFPFFCLSDPQYTQAPTPAPSMCLLG
jgi:hypothetical protein